MALRPRRPRSLTYRLTLGYSIWFALSFATIMILAFLFSVVFPLWDVKRQVQGEAEGFARDYAGPRDVPHLVKMLEARSIHRDSRQPYHVLWSPAGAVLTTTLPSNFKRLRGEPWLRFEFNTYDDGIERENEAVAYVTQLRDGSRLLVGRDTQDLDDREELLLNGLVWCTGLALVLGLLGGMVVSRSVGRRIDAVASAADRVMAGDLSERIEVAGSGDDFDHLATTLNAMLDRIEDLVQSVSRVSDSIAHELRTPLTRLAADLDDLKRARDAATGDRLIDQAIASSTRLQSTFDALLRVARIETRRQQPARENADLADLLGDAVDLYRPSAIDKGVTLETAFAPRLMLPCERDLVFQAIANLLDNAIKYVPRGGTIRIAGTRNEGGIVITIADDGPGVSQQDHARLTERFYRAPTTDSRSGLGLGLTLVQAIVRRHDATLSFHDNMPGLRVSIFFPAMA